MKNTTLQQYNYHQWASNRFFEHLKDLPDDVYDNEIQSVFSSVSEVIIHIYQVDGLWLSIMLGDAFEETMSKIDRIIERSANQGLNEMQQLYGELVEKYTSFLIDHEYLDRLVVRLEMPALKVRDEYLEKENCEIFSKAYPFYS